MKIYTKSISIALLGLFSASLVITGCGSPGADNSLSIHRQNSEISPEPVKSFGSVYVNGVKFETHIAELKFGGVKTRNDLSRGDSLIYAQSEPGFFDIKKPSQYTKID